MAELKGQDKQRYVAEMFDRITGRYDLMNTLMTGRLHLGWKQKTARLTSEGLTGPALDIATGTGDLALYLAKQPGMEQVIGLDFLPGMIARAKAKAVALGVAGKTDFLVGDAHDLPFGDDSFACATAGFSLRNMADLKSALKEMVRVVRRGGRVTTLELTPVKPGGASLMLRWHSQALVPLLGQVVGRDRAAYTYLPQSVDHFLEADQLSAIFREIGLSDVGYTRMGFGAVTLHRGVKI